MKSRPILFSGPMVRAILAGTKTQTRRVIKPQPIFYGENSPFARAINPEIIGKPWMPVGGVYQDRWPCKYGSVGDRLWVRETWADVDGMGFDKDLFTNGFAYRADCNTQDSLDIAKQYGVKWKPSIHMFREASRITLEIVGIRVERLNEIRACDAIAEGIEAHTFDAGGSTITTFKDYLTGAKNLAAKQSFQTLWESINGKGSWDANPWVWVIEFKRAEGAQ